MEKEDRTVQDSQNLGHAIFKRIYSKGKAMQITRHLSRGRAASYENVQCIIAKVWQGPNLITWLF